MLLRMTGNLQCPRVPRLGFALYSFTMSDRASQSASGTAGVVLAGDIGGTNTTLALVSTSNKRYEILERKRLGSRELTSVSDALHQARRAFGIELWRNIGSCCLCAAGPVDGQRARMSNLGWDIDGEQVQQELGVATRVINDFTGICYGIPVLYRQSPEQFVAIPHTDGTVPEPSGSVIGVVGAGTGLGVGFLTRMPDGSVAAHPSEGGHSDFAPFDDETLALRSFVASRYDDIPGAECFLSGQGIVNIFDFVVSDTGGALSPTVQEILRLEPGDRPPSISANVDGDAACRRTMDIFVRVYARFAASAALHFFATGGVFLAGGIVPRNRDLFLRQDRFMSTFERNYKATVRPLLRRVPVHIVADYSVSIYGAAYAAIRFAGPRHDDSGAGLDSGDAFGGFFGRNTAAPEGSTDSGGDRKNSMKKGDIRSAAE